MRRPACVRACLGSLALAGLVLAPPAVAVEATEAEVHVFFIGDAGAPAERDEPVLTALTRELSRDPARSFVVFLGDNVYPRGLTPLGTPERAESERRLLAQLEAVASSGATALFIPGNHDWDRHAAGGWDAIRREARFVEEHGAGFLPKEGCPGPSTLDVGRRFKLVVLDTQWWLHDGPKPMGPGSQCEEHTEAEVTASLRAAIKPDDDRLVAVVAHHPLDSGGGHGGHFDWKEHVFPLRAWRSWLWLPLPGIGSVYPVARKAGVFAQDMPAAVNRHMRRELEAALADRPPLLWACGHDHGLQVLRGRSARYLLVSGAGIYGHTKTPLHLDETLFASGAAGFMRVDVTEAGAPHLVVFSVSGRGEAAETFSRVLD